MAVDPSFSFRSSRRDSKSERQLVPLSADTSPVAPLLPTLPAEAPTVSPPFASASLVPSLSQYPPPLPPRAPFATVFEVDTAMLARHRNVQLATGAALLLVLTIMLTLLLALRNVCGGEHLRYSASLVSRSNGIGDQSGCGSSMSASGCGRVQRRSKNRSKRTRTPRQAGDDTAEAKVALRPQSRASPLEHAWSPPPAVWKEAMLFRTSARCGQEASYKGLEIGACSSDCTEQAKTEAAEGSVCRMALVTGSACAVEGAERSSAHVVSVAELTHVYST